MNNQETDQKAKVKSGSKTEFYTHLTIYLVVNCALVILNLAVTKGFPWAIFPLIGWGIGLFFHGLSTFSSTGGSAD
jgi:hypothetical protein